MFSAIQRALASGVEFASAVIFFNGIFIPCDFKNALIAGADSTGLAVNIKLSLTPNFFILSANFLKKGPFSPLTTLLNSEKSNLWPCCNKAAP